MKRSIVLLLGLIFATISSANIYTNFEKPKCRESLKKIDARLSLSAQIEQDLLQGIWIQGTERSFDKMAQFTESGVATFLEATKMGAFYEAGRYTWRLEIVNEDPILILRPLHSDEEHRLRVEQTCQGINLINVVTGHLQSFDFVAVDAAQQSRMRSALTGSWNNSLASVTLTDGCAADKKDQLKLENVNFQLEFRNDGTFTRTLSSRDSDLMFTESGTWEISKDGKQLLLHCRDGKGKIVTQCTKIKYLEMDELVLEYPLATIGKRFVAEEENSDFFFNKF